MILLLAALSAHALEFGVSGGLAVAPGTEDAAALSAGSGSIYGALGVLGIVRGEAHLGYTGLAALDEIEDDVRGRAVDLRAMGGVSLPLFSPPLAELGADVLVGPNLRFSQVQNGGGVWDMRMEPSVHLGLSAGPYLELPLVRLGLRGWLDVPGRARVGVTAMAGVRI